MAVGFHDMHPMRQPVQHGPGQTFGAADLHPLLERQIGRDDQALAFVGSADHLEERFGLSGGQGPMIWIAGGSGVSPFWSMLRHMLNRGLRRDCRFFLGAARQHDLALREELEQLQQRVDWLRFIPVVAEPGGDDWTGQVGLVTDVVDRQVASGDPAEAYVCGPPGLIDSAVKVLSAKGFGPERIFMDKFLTHEPIRPA